MTASLCGLGERRLLPELMDDPALDPARHRAALLALARVNRLSGTAGRVWDALREIPRRADRPLRVLDVACGGGDVAVWLARRARAEGLGLNLTGCDLSPGALEVARERARVAGVEVEWHGGRVPEELPEGRWDLVYSTLFLHHLPHVDAVALLAALAPRAEWIVVDDLRRTCRGLVLAWMAGRLLTRSPVVRVDGPRSVRGAFTLAEARALAAEAGLAGARVRRAWPQRWALRWERPRPQVP